MSAPPDGTPAQRTFAPHGQVRELIPASRLGLAGSVQEALVDLILTGELVPGQPLRIGALAERLGVSATPIREALVGMEATGMATRENNKGFRVAPRPTPAELDDLFEARVTLEAKIARLAAPQVTARLCKGLADTLETQRQLSEGTTFEAFRGFLDADRQFHHLIAQAAANRFLASALEMLGSHLHRYRSFDATVVTDRSETLAEHQAILDALRSANPEMAEAAMTLHLGSLRARVAREQSGMANAVGQPAI